MIRYKEEFCSTRVVKHWHRFPREVVGALSLETFKSESPDLDEGVPAYCKGLDQVAFKGPFQPK